ncbi:MAG: hypothetical protein HN348_10390 [Proteobacteria bacterium]|nr:hypothetical protein [Pseudomonadota bacterium]
MASGSFFQAGNVADSGLTGLTGSGSTGGAGLDTMTWGSGSGSGEVGRNSSGPSSFTRHDKTKNDESAATSIGV